MTIQNVMSYMPTKYQVLIYGPSGTGKTIFGASWARAESDGKKLLMLDSDKGILSVVTASSALLPDDVKANIFPVHIKDMPPGAKTPQGYLTVNKVLDEVINTGAYDNIRPHTIVIDSLTTLSEMILAQTVRANGRIEPVIKDWGQQMDKLTKLINKARSIENVNFIAVAHEQYTKDEISGRIWCLPLVTGKLAPKISLYFDEVYHTTVNQKGDKHEYVMHTKATGLITAKSRFDLPSPSPTGFGALKGRIETLQKKAGQFKQGEDNKQEDNELLPTKIP